MRGLRLGVTLCLLGAALVLAGCLLDWGTVVEDAPPLPARALHPHGTSLAPGLRGLGVLGALGVLGIAATRGPGRRLVGLVVLAAGAGVTVVTSLWLQPGELHRALRRWYLHCESGCGSVSRTTATLHSVTAHHLGLWLALTGSLVLAAAGLLTLVRGGTWSRLGSSYEAPTVASVPSAESGAPSDKVVWDALDRGDDPTA